MKIGLIGLGKMGLNLAKNMLRHGHQVVGFDLQTDNLHAAQAAGALTASSISDLVHQLPGPRIVWVMVPAGHPTDSLITSLHDLLDSGDFLLDGGNSFYKDSQRHAHDLAIKQIHFFDVGTSGGMSGANENGNFMIGGEQAYFPVIEPLFKDIAANQGYLYTGPAGSGHYLKMVHNGIEYGMMEAIGEGFEVLQSSEFNYDNAQVAQLWNHGSVIRSWLMELAQDAFSQDANLDQLKGVMHTSGEGQWTLDAALNQKVATPVIGLALMMRYRSQTDDTFTGKVVAALRNEFGGHAVDKE